MGEERIQGWRAQQPGDSITGTLVRYEMRRDKKGREHRVAIISTAQGERAIWLFRGTCGYVFDRERPEVGDAIKLWRWDDRELEDGRVFERYDMTVTRAEAPADEIPMPDADPF